MSWSPYPSEPRQRRSTVTRDVLAVLAVILLAWLGRRVYRLVDDLRDDMVAVLRVLGASEEEIRNMLVGTVTSSLNPRQVTVWVRDG